MRKKTGSILGTFLLCSIVLLPMSLLAQRIDCFVLKAPDCQLHNVTRIGILDFGGRGSAGRQLVDYMIAGLLNPKRGIEDISGGFMGLGRQIEGITYMPGAQTNIFTIVERSHIDRVLKEQRMSLSGTIDEQTAAHVGKLLGLDAIIVGEVNWERRDEYPTRDRINLEAKVVTDQCHLRVVTSNSSMKIVSVETAEILGTIALREETSDRKCGDNRRNVASESDLLTDNMQTVARKFVDHFTPVFVPARYELERIRVRHLRRQVDEAASLVERKDIKRALPLYYAIYQEDSYNPSAAYNLGVLLEITGSFEEAKNYYNIAQQLDGSNIAYSEGLARAKAGVGLASYLEKIGRPLRPVVDSKKEVDLFARKITIRGRSMDRAEVYVEPDRRSMVVARVPGGLEFTVVSQHGDWYKIKLLDDKEGFVHRSNTN